MPRVAVLRRFSLEPMRVCACAPDGIGAGMTSLFFPFVAAVRCAEPQSTARSDGRNATLTA
eukprot:298792-Alexandrium_andersonii.AAC.1